MAAVVRTQTTDELATFAEEFVRKTLELLKECRTAGFLQRSCKEQFGIAVLLKTWLHPFRSFLGSTEDIVFLIPHPSTGVMFRSCPLNERRFGDSQLEQRDANGLNWKVDFGTLSGFSVQDARHFLSLLAFAPARQECSGLIFLAPVVHPDDGGVQFVGVRHCPQQHFRFDIRSGPRVSMKNRFALGWSNPCSILAGYELANYNCEPSWAGIRLYLSWKGTPTLIPPASARSYLEIDQSSTAMKSPGLSDLRRELEFLTMLVRPHGACDIEDMANSVERPSLPCSVLLADLFSGCFRLQLDDCEQLASPFWAPVLRTDLDFTEQLWTICSTNPAMTPYLACEAVRQTLDQLKKGSLQPTLHRNNHLSLANLLRESTNHARLQTALDAGQQRDAIVRAIDFWTSDYAMLRQSLIELGFSKLRKDLSHFLLNDDLVSVSDISPFVTSADGTVDQNEQLRQLSVLLDTCLLLYLVRNHVPALPDESLREIARNAILAFDSRTSRDHHVRLVYHLPEFNSAVANLVNSVSRSLEPISWEIRPTEDGACFEVQRFSTASELIDCHSFEDDAKQGAYYPTIAKTIAIF